MNKLKLALLCTCFATSVLPSKTFFTDRSITTNPLYELANNNFEMNGIEKDEDCSWQFFATPFYKKSTKGKDIAKYFMPNNETCATFKEDGTGEIGSVWFGDISNLNTTYRSTICLKPEQYTVGGAFLFHFNLDRLRKNLWLTLNSVIVKKSNKPGLTENNRLYDGIVAGIKNAVDGLCPQQEPKFTYGNICNCSTSQTGLDDIQIKLGYSRCYNKSLYATLLIPTGRNVKPYNMLQPFVGTRHWAAGVGFNANKSFSQKENSFWNAAIDCKFSYAFSAKETRSFDLTANGPWSRYLLVVKSDETSTTLPGTNLFTTEATVAPRYNFNLWSALHYEKNNFRAEAGYLLWYRAQEHIRNLSAISEGYGIADLVGIITSSATSSSTAKISNGPTAPNAAASDVVFTKLKTIDLDTCSAEHPSAISNTLYASIGSQFTNENKEFGFNLGSAYEIGRGNSALSSWSIWLNTFINF